MEAVMRPRSTLDPERTPRLLLSLNGAYRETL
jgi:hypothetical protein